MKSTNAGIHLVSQVLSHLLAGNPTSCQQEQFSPEEEAKKKEAVGSGDEHNLEQDIGNSDRLSSDPEDYHQAKKTLKKAFLEHYR
jgi:hypothetical protein